MSWTRKTVYKKLREKFGLEHQMWKMIEEVGEFLHAFSYLRTTVMRGEKKKIKRWALESINELADLELMLDSAKDFIAEHSEMDVDKGIELAKNRKIKKMKKLLRED